MCSSRRDAREILGHLDLRQVQQSDVAPNGQVCATAEVSVPMVETVNAGQQPLPLWLDLLGCGCSNPVRSQEQGEHRVQWSPIAERCYRSVLGSVVPGSRRRRKLPRGREPGVLLRPGAHLPVAHYAALNEKGEITYSEHLDLFGRPRARQHRSKLGGTKGDQICIRSLHVRMHAFRRFESCLSGAR